MLKKKLTLLVIPGSDSAPRQIRLRVLSLYIGLAVAVILIFASFFLSAEFFRDRVAEQELADLRAENAALQEKYEQMRWNLAEVESRYDDLVQREIRIRSLFSLPEVDIEERQLGIGGPPDPAVEVKSEALLASLDTEAEVDHLLRLSTFELEKYAEVEASLLDVKDRLDHTPSIWPTRGWVSRGYGMKHDPFTGMKQMHRGLDIANHTGTPVVATADGRIKRVGKNGGMGKTIVIDHGYGFVTRYAHLSEYKVKRGARVKRGDVIGLMGSTGYSTGPHLHYEVMRSGKARNPYNYMLNSL